MKTTSVSFRLTWEDLDNIKYIQYYYAERCLTKTDVLRMLLRDARRELEAEVAALRQPHERDYSVDLDTTLKDFLRSTEMSNEELADIGMDSGAINPEPAPGLDEH